MTWQRAQQATAGLILRKLPKPRYVPLCAPTIDICDLTVNDYHGRNPVKHIVDIILNHQSPISESVIKRCVNDGDLDALPPIARPPPGAVPVNYFQQVAFIPVANGASWNVVKHLTFISDAEDGRVKGELARTYQHGELHLINFGSNNKVGKRIFQHLFQLQMNHYQVLIIVIQHHHLKNLLCLI